MFISFSEQKANGMLGIQTDESLLSLPSGALLNTFHLLGNQVLYLWNTFLQFHRLAFISGLIAQQASKLHTHLHFGH